MSGISVRGGSNGIEANYGDMTALARVFGSAATSTAEQALSLHADLVNPDVVSAAVLDPYGAARFSGALLDALDGPGGLSWLGAECSARDLDLRTAAATYLEADRLDATYGPALRGLTDLADLAPNTVADAIQGHPCAAALRVPADVSDVVTAAASGFWHNWLLINLVSVYPDGRPVVHARGLDRSAVATRAPRSVSEVMSELAHRSDHRSGGDIDVRFLTSTGSDGHEVRHVIVDIPGIDTVDPSWSTSDPTTFGATLRSLTGTRTTYSNGVIQAMRDAGVAPGDPVMLVGHSQGGMVAMNVAKDTAGTGEFNVTHVITAGSPVAHLTVPRSVQVLSIENQDDFVPHLDGASNADRVNQSTVTVHRTYGALLANHDVDNYVTSARAIDSSDDPSVRSFLAGAGGFLGGTTVTTRVFGVQRRVPPRKRVSHGERTRSTDPRNVK